MKKVIRKTLISISCSALLTFLAQATPTDSFIVQNIKVTGLKRVSTGTVLNYLPVQIGEEITPSSTSDIIRTLYETGFFQAVSLERNNQTLIVNVVERATVGSISVNGNKEIPADKMKELLKQLGLSKGRVYQRAALERLEKELKEAYTARGKYNARITSKVTALTENRVAIVVTVSEGRVSRIREIKFIGNHDFSSNELLPEITLAPSGVFTYFSKKDQYSKAAMDASLEAIRSFYLDRGYLKFEIISSQVMLSPDKKDVFIHIHIKEGPQYRFSGYEVVGHPMLSKVQLARLVNIKNNATFSRQKVTESISALGLALGDKGFGFPAINAEPRIDETHKTVFITFLIDPGRHVYVRHIHFHGNTKTGDYVLRSIIRQNEGGLLSLHNIKESERQIRLLGYIKNVNIATTPVAGANNQVDLDVNIQEAPSAEANASLGYGTNGPQFNTAFNQHNFMGTGRSVGLSFNASYWGQEYSFNYYNPFYTNTGIGRGINLYYRVVDPDKLNVVTYSADQMGADINYNILLGEASSMQFGFGFQNLYVKSAGSVQQIQNFVNEFGVKYDELRLTGGWSRNSYNQMPFPTSGINQQATALLAFPVTSNSLSYFKSSYSFHAYQPLMRGFILSLFGNIGYGDGFRQNQGLPFFENYYAGGVAVPGQIRGYESFSLGPHDIHGNAIGGNFLINGSAALILPYPVSRENLRVSGFVDAGNVFARGTPAAFTNQASDAIRYSAGLALEWRSPFGPLSFSLAKPLNLQPGDEKQFFQFTLSSTL